MRPAPPAGLHSKVSSCTLHDDEASNEPRKHLIFRLNTMGAGTTGVRGQAMAAQHAATLGLNWILVGVLLIALMNVLLNTVLGSAAQLRRRAD